MKQAIFYAAVVIVVVAAAAYAWHRNYAVKPQNLPYTMGNTGSGTDFMDTAKAKAGVTPVKGNLESVSLRTDFTNPWAGAVVAIKSTMPTGNPVNIQAKRIFW